MYIYKLYAAGKDSAGCSGSETTMVTTIHRGMVAVEHITEVGSELQLVYTPSTIHWFNTA